VKTATADLPPPPKDTPPPCPNCGAATTDGQQVCLECGQDLSRAYRRAPGSRVWIAAGVAAVLAVGVGAGFAIGALTNDNQKKKAAEASASTAIPSLPGPPATTPAPTSPTTPATPTTPTTPATPTTPTTPAPTTPTTPSVPPATPPSTAAVASWPPGKTAYTVVLVSAKNRSQARAKAKEATTRGIDAGVLHSNDYSSLNPGYWVVFAGQYKTADEARAKIDAYAGEGFPGGYPRLVKK
jgi:predicted nucleic acid-binding Zn ribbon protein